jgi:hypothetical protein
MNADPMFARLHDRLDRGEDPLDDAELVAWLETHPESLDQAVRLRADARDLPRLPRPTSLPHHSRRPPWLRAAAVGIALGSVAAATVLLVGSGTPTATPAAGPRIVTAHFEELRARAHASAAFFVHDARSASASATLDSYTLHSEHR